LPDRAAHRDQLRAAHTADNLTDSHAEHDTASRRGQAITPSGKSERTPAPAMGAPFAPGAESQADSSCRSRRWQDGGYNSLANKRRPAPPVP